MSATSWEKRRNAPLIQFNWKNKYGDKDLFHAKIEQYEYGSIELLNT